MGKYKRAYEELIVSMAKAEAKAMERETELKVCRVNLAIAEDTSESYKYFYEQEVAKVIRLEKNLKESQ